MIKSIFDITLQKTSRVSLFKREIFLTLEDYNLVKNVGKIAMKVTNNA